jgi:hypothetical protein
LVFDGVAYYGTGNFACFMTTHAIGNQPEAVLRLTEKAIFIVIAR